MNRAQLYCILMLFVAAAGCSATPPPVCAQGEYVELRADLPPDEAAELAAEADAFLVDISELLDCTPPHPTVIVFANGRSLWLYLRQECSTFADRRGACFEADDGRMIVALRAESGGLPNPRKLRHELTHAVIGSNFVRPMPWLDEGFAQMKEMESFGEMCERFDKLVGCGDRVRPDLIRLLSTEKHVDLDKDDYLLAFGFVLYLGFQEGLGYEAIMRCFEPPIPGETAAERCTRSLGATPEELADRFVKYLDGLAADDESVGK